jgi:hypothetical protein
MRILGEHDEINGLHKPRRGAVERLVSTKELPEHDAAAWATGVPAWRTVN